MRDVYVLRFSKPTEFSNAFAEATDEELVEMEEYDLFIVFTLDTYLLPTETTVRATTDMAADLATAFATRLPVLDASFLLF